MVVGVREHIQTLNSYNITHSIYELHGVYFQMIADLNTFLNKAVPDTRLTIKKYLDAKFEYLVRIL